MKVKIADKLFMPYVRSAHLTGDNSHLSPSHFEWELASPTEARFVTELSMYEARGEGQVCWILEPFFLHKQNYTWLMENHQKFDAVLTHQPAFADNLGWLWHPFGGSMINFGDWGLCEKTKNVSMLLSYKNYQPGHVLRHKVVERFRDRFDDIFGLVPWGRKIEALAPYRFAVVIETERSCGYFTEKLIDCLSVGTIPIFWGCPDIGNFFDPAGILPFKDLDELGGILDWIERGGTELYERCHDAIAFNLREASKYAICEDQIWDRYPQLFEVSS